jgi:hypothetical protein
MFDRSQLQANAWSNRSPVVPSGWPNRATRRACRFNKLHRLSREWAEMLGRRAGLKQEIARMA